MASEYRLGSKEALNGLFADISEACADADKFYVDHPAYITPKVVEKFHFTDDFMEKATGKGQIALSGTGFTGLPELS